jgi:hypothetical protein
MAEWSPHSEGAEGDRDGLSSASASGTTEGVGGGAVSPLHSEDEVEMEVGEVASSPTAQTRVGSFTSESSNADDMDVHEDSGGEAEILRLEDLEVQRSIAEPQEQDGNEDRDNRKETRSLNSSVHSHKDEGDSSQTAERVGDDTVSNPVTPATPTKMDKKEKKKKKKKKGKSNEGEKQEETAADSESRNASSSWGPQPSA